MKALQNHIVRLLSVLAPNKSMTGREILQRWHGERHYPADLRRAINKLRREQVPIGSNQRGYHLCRSEQQWKLTSSQLKSRERLIRLARKGGDNYFKKGKK